VIGSKAQFSRQLTVGEHQITIVVKDRSHSIKRTVSITVRDHLLEDPAKKDSDGDGMNDAYENMYARQDSGSRGLDRDDPSDALKDFDGDGFTNLREYLAGTDPMDKDSRPGGTLVEERFPVLPIVLLAIGLLLVIVFGVLFAREFRRPAPAPLYVPGPPMVAYPPGYSGAPYPGLPGTGHPGLPPAMGRQ